MLPVVGRLRIRGSRAGAGHEPRLRISVRSEADARARGRSDCRSEPHGHGRGRVGPAEREGTAEVDAEGGRYGGRARGGAGTGAVHDEGPGGGAPDSDLAEAHGAGGSDGGIALRDGAGDGRTRALLPVRIHGGDRDAVGRASRQTRELEAERLIRWRDQGRGRDLNEAAARAR
jgi:hypothetical protein